MPPTLSSDVVLQWECSVVLKTPSRSVVGQVLTGCHPTTVPRTEMEFVEQHQTPRNVASGRTTTE
jgi:hypothetical protein